MRDCCIRGLDGGRIVVEGGWWRVVVGGWMIEVCCRGWLVEGCCRVLDGGWSLLGVA